MAELDRPESALKAVMHHATALLVASLAVVAGVRPAAAETGESRRAPTRLHAEPPGFFLLPLGGDRAHFRYTPGSLDRASNLQQRIEVLARGFERWLDQPVNYTVFVMSRREWQEAGIIVDYGIPVRVGMRGLAVPAQGDEDTVELWSGLLGGMLPTVVGTPIRGTPQEVASMMMADVVAQLLASEILIDTAELAGDQPWVRAVMTQLAALTVVKRLAQAMRADLGVRSAPDQGSCFKLTMPVTSSIKA